MEYENTPGVAKFNPQETKDVNPIVKKLIDLIDDDKCTIEMINNAYIEKKITQDDAHFLTTFLGKVQERSGFNGLVKKEYFESHLAGFCEELDITEEKRKGGSKLKSLMVVYVDLEDFKKINDTYGHAVGDQVLIKVAERIKGVTRNEDLAARMGGDEFAVAMPSWGENMPSIESIKKKLRDDLYIEGPSGRIEINISVGYAVKVPTDGFTWESLLIEADKNMYQDKIERKGSRLAR